MLSALAPSPAAGAPTFDVDRPSGAVAVRDGSRTLLAEAGGYRVGFRSAGAWRRATRIAARRSARGRTVLQLATDDPARRRLEVTLRRGSSISLRVRVLGSGPQVDAVGIGFRARAGERYLGFGQRSNAVDQRGREVQNRVQEGPFQPEEYATVDLTIPDWALFPRRDATYFPMPWLLSTGGYGVLIANLTESLFRLGSERRGVWSVEADARTLSLRVFAGRPAALVRQLTRVTGRQPAPAAPWLLGPWFQTGHANVEPGELEHARTLRRGDAPVSVVETHMRYMPCGADQGQEVPERARTRAFHRLGLAALTYLREAVCQSYPAAFDRGAALGVFLRRPGGAPYTFESFVGGGVTQVGMIDFGNPRADAYYASLLRRATRNGYDGWMEDYGEYTPPGSRSANGRTAATMRNLYPVLYHRSGYRFARAQRRPIVRFIRSGWSGVHPYAQVVWGGDPTTGWGFDGLRSSVIQALTMGLSGISLWGSDVGGFFTLSEERLTPELLARWIQFGAVSGVMRTKAGGSAPPRPSGRRSGSRGCCRSGGATRSSAPSCTRTSAPPPASTAGPAFRSCGTSPSPTRGTGGPWPPTTSCCSAPTCSRRRSPAQGSDGGACTSRAATGSTSGARSATSAAPAAWPSAARGCCAAGAP